jgi:hypothetical protein
MRDPNHQPLGDWRARLLRLEPNRMGSEAQDKTYRETSLAVLASLQEPVLDERLDLAKVAKQIKRLDRGVYRVNTLTEAQNEQNRQVTRSWRQLLGQIELEREDAAQDAAWQRSLDPLHALLAVLDAVESGIFRGVAPIKAILPTAPQAAGTRAAWPNRQSLLYDQLNKLIEAEGTHRIPTIDESLIPTDTWVKTVCDAAKAPGVIVAEERHRYTEVVVNQQ